jgi:hypothetical protein
MSAKSGKPNPPSSIRIPSSSLQDYTPSNKLVVVEGCDLQLFALITSKMHMAWTKFVGGRLESRYQYSPGINYNPFLWPHATAAQEKKLADLAQAVLDARATHPGATLANLYDPDIMPTNLRKAHRALDAAVDKLYQSAPFGSDRERVEHLFGLYEKLVAPLSAVAAKPKRAGRRTVPA